MLDHILIFADDYHLRWAGVTEAAFYKALKEAAEILEPPAEKGTPSARPRIEWRNESLLFPSACHIISQEEA